MPFLSSAGTAQLAPAAAGARPKSRRNRLPYVGVEVYERFEDVAEVWAELEAACPASAYQTRRWLHAWSTSKGAETAAAPMLIVARGRDGSALALLPLGIARRGFLRVASFLGGTDSNANIGLFRPGVAWTETELRRLLATAARRVSPTPDVFTLLNQPATWEGEANPLAPLFGQFSPSQCHSTRLGADFPTWLADKLSADTRKKLAKKRKKLEREIGPVRHIFAADPSTSAQILEAFFDQKLARFRSQGIDSEFERPSARDFLTRACIERGESDEPAIELHALAAGDRIVATYGGTLHRRRFHAMFNSFDMAEDASRCSPGDLLLMAMLEQMSARGVETFDLGLGEARYKETWCEVAEPMFDSLTPVSIKGRVWAMAESARLRVKRRVKQTPWMWSIVKRVRAARKVGASRS